jgi:hypothetical protein
MSEKTYNRVHFLEAFKNRKIHKFQRDNKASNSKERREKRLQEKKCPQNSEAGVGQLWPESQIQSAFLWPLS